MSNTNVINFVKQIGINDQLRNRVSAYKFTDYTAANEFILVVAADFGFKLSIDYVICFGSTFSQQLAKGSKGRPGFESITKALESVFPAEYHLCHKIDRALRDTYRPKWWQLSRRFSRWLNET